MIKEIVAPKGKYLTQSAEVLETERIYITRILGDAETIDDNWKIATSTEKTNHDKIIAETVE